MCCPEKNLLEKKFFCEGFFLKKFFLWIFLWSFFFYEIIFNVCTLLGAYIGYDWYVDNASGFDVVETKSGLGFILIFFLDFILVFFSTRLMKVYKDNRFTIFYNLFFIGLVLKIFFLNIFIFGRSYVYFYSFRFIVMAFLCHYLVFENKTSYPLKLLGIGLLIIQIALFFLTLDKEALAPFQFVW